jgi:hypothetical protein
MAQLGIRIRGEDHVVDPRVRENGAINKKFIKSFFFGEIEVNSFVIKVNSGDRFSNRTFSYM